jgi:hypothetical protein
MTPPTRTPLERLVDALQILLPAVQRIVHTSAEQRTDATQALMAARRAAAIVDELKPGPEGAR